MYQRKFHNFYTKHSETFIEFSEYNSYFFEYQNKFDSKPIYADVNSDMIKAKYDEVVEWVKEHCKGYVLYVHGDEMFFEHLQEAMMFKVWLC